MKFLILGAGGMAGHTISIYLKENGHDVTGFARRGLDYVDTVVGDVTDFGFLKETVIKGNYDCVVNCVGLLNKYAEENKANAVLINGYLPHFLVEITKDMKTKVMQMSTDCVFSGKTGNYKENSFKDGETFYDRTKAIGEIEDSKNITFRNSIVGPDINENGIGLFNWFMQQEEQVYGFTKAMWTGLTTLQLAKIIEKAAIDNVCGLYNMVPNKNISKYDLLNIFNHYFRNDKLEIIPNDDFVVDKSLIRTNMNFDVIVPDYETMVKEMADWVISHKDLYPHYKLENGGVK